MISQEYIKDSLEKMADAKYRDFVSAINPYNGKVYGVRLPLLRKFAKEIVKEGYNVDFLNLPNVDSVEERMLHGFVIGYSGFDFNTLLAYIKDFVSKIDCWAVCDSCCSTFKGVKKDLPSTFSFSLGYLKSDKEFEQRFGLVMLICYFIVDDYIDRVINELKQVSVNAYYSKMALAWCVAECFIKYPEKSLELVQDMAKDIDLFRMTKRKILDSYRVDCRYKDIIRSMQM